MKGRRSDPPECRNAYFNKARYHECVLVNPLKAATTTTTTAPDKTKPYICAENDGDSCECDGKVYYGKKFMDGRPGGGVKTTWEQMLFFGHKVKDVNGRVTCNTRYMGGDPIWGYYKHCYCVTSLFSTTTTTTPSGLESCPITIGSSRANTKCVSHPREVICAGNAGNKGFRAGGGNHGDVFAVTVTGGFQVCARRVDSRSGWGMRLQLNCVCPPTTTTTTTTTEFADVVTPPGLELCPVDIGRSRSNERCVNYHRTVFCSRLAGNKGMRAGGGNWNDAFDVNVVDGTKVCVRRTDSGGGWNMRLKLGCGCQTTTTTSTPSGLEFCPVSIGRSGAGQKCVTFNREVFCAANSGDRGIRAGGGNWNDKFNVQVNGNQVCAERQDQNAGWSMNLKLRCGCPTTTTTTTTDYRRGQRAGCAGCGWRRDECWNTCGRKRGMCSKCNSREGSVGACCMRGDRNDPPECKNAHFSQSGYHECVLVNPLQGPPDYSAATKCADEGGNCQCNGKVFYGKRYNRGRPGWGRENSLAEAVGGATKQKDVSGSVTCSGANMGGDPVYGYYKSCWCLPQAQKAANNGGVDANGCAPGTNKCPAGCSSSSVSCSNGVCKCNCSGCPGAAAAGGAGANGCAPGTNKCPAGCSSSSVSCSNGNCKCTCSGCPR